MNHRSQIVVLVTVVGVDHEAEVYYTYTDFRTGTLHVSRTIADVNGVIPYDTVFALDYASTRNGWRFSNEIRPAHLDGFHHSLSDNEMLMVTADDDPRHPRRFSLKYHNHVTGQHFWNDPQEGNVYQPK